MALSEEDKAELAEFHKLVNMTASELEKWLETEESREVGQKATEGSESTGHASGRMIVKILHKKQGDLDEADWAEIRRVVSYCKRHLAQRPSGDVRETRWRYSLMNWGHDPLKH